ncbi:MAG: KpsF/GutQ family sugar-phosphate isomerase [Nitrospirota bacterium]|jgi:arabinose-5-phosphate isomerase
MTGEERADILEHARRVLHVEARAITDMAGRLNEDFARSVEVIQASRGRVIVSGMGKSGLVGQKIAATLASTGTPAHSMHPAEACHGDLGMVTSADVVLAISNSGETEELVGLIPFLKRFGVTLIALTGNLRSTLARSADVVLDVSVKEEACPLGVVPTSSTTAALAMGDALAVALILKRGFRSEDFAAFHPKGALGKKLLTRVSDLMHAGEDIPRVPPEASVTAALVEMSAKRLGVTTVVDGDGKLLGVITDGDLRRGIEKWEEAFFGMKAGEVMTRSPKTIAATELAARALAVMEAHSITSLVAVGGAGAPEGVIHIHDILREGIA